MEKRKGYRAGTSSVRQDYSKGGRVQAANGGMLTFNQWKAEHAKTNPRPTGGGIAGHRAKQKYDAQQVMYHQFKKPQKKQQQKKQLNKGEKLW